MRLRTCRKTDYRMNEHNYIVVLDCINYYHDINKASNTTECLHRGLGCVKPDSIQVPSTKQGGSNCNVPDMFGSCLFQILAETPTSLMGHFFAFLSSSRQFRNAGIVF
jgi:hypothetical protein